MGFKELVRKIFYSMGIELKINWDRRFSKLGEYAVNDSNLSLDEIKKNTQYQSFRYKKIIQQLKIPGEEISALDFGCGIGRFGQMISSAFPMQKCTLTGYDPITRMLNVCSLDTYQHLNNNFEEIALKKYDFIFIHMVLGGLSLSEAQERIFQLVRTLKPGGAIFLVEAISSAGSYEHNLWKAREDKVYMPSIEGFSWEIVDEFTEAISTLKIIIGRFY
jgi:2-polyprenyl-3-methyl-5-hydroxy-6-metoxy-1,4-benzoquinol methylase